MDNLKWRETTARAYASFGGSEWRHRRSMSGSMKLQNKTRGAGKGGGANGRASGGVLFEGFNAVRARGVPRPGRTFNARSRLEMLPSTTMMRATEDTTFDLSGGRGHETLHFGGGTIESKTKRRCALVYHRVKR